MKVMNSPISPGNVFWITGLAGSGKSTIAEAFYQSYKEQNPSTVWLDGDHMREILGPLGLGYSLSERKEKAYIYARLCQTLSHQNINVICSTISMFHEIHQWNRNHIQNYHEIFLKVSLETLIRRDQKGLYRRALNHEITGVMGIDLKPEFPLEPDLVIENEDMLAVDTVMNILAGFK